MDNDIDSNKKLSLLTKLLNNKAYIYIFIGLAIRIFMFMFYLFSDAYDPSWNWGDTEKYYIQNVTATPFSIVLLTIFRALSFGHVAIFGFWAFLWDFLICLMFYYVLKSFEVKDIYYAFGLFLINSFFILNNTFGLGECGYNITDAFFFLFFFLTLIYSTKEDPYQRYLFYLFLGLSMCTKYYTIPALGFFFLKYSMEKNWKQMKVFILIIAPFLLLLLVLPLFLYEPFRVAFFQYPNYGDLPIYIRIIPIGSIFLLYTIFRLRKAKEYEIIILSILSMGTFLFFSYPYVRWFQILLFYGILTQKELILSFKINLKFFKREIKVDNHLATFYLSFIGVLLAVIFIIFVIN